MLFRRGWVVGSVLSIWLSFFIYVESGNTFIQEHWQDSLPISLIKDNPEEPKTHTGAPRALNLSRTSAVKVERPDEDGYGSGAYMKMYGYHVIITAAHVVDDFSNVLIHGRNGEIVLGRVLIKSLIDDYAIIQVPQLKTRKPINYRPQKEHDLVGTDVVYSGYPNKYDLLTITGRVAGAVGQDDRLIVHSYGWMGASGAGLFDYAGRFVGIVVAVDVASFDYYSPQIVEDLIWVVPSWKLDEEMIKVRLKLSDKKQWPEMKQIPGAPAPRRGGLPD